jgi:hypothetical protein
MSGPLRRSLRWRIGEIEAAWIKAKVHQVSLDPAGFTLFHPAIQTGYDGRGLPRFRVPAGRRFWRESVFSALDSAPGRSV